jgi:hypothetical protein
MVDIPPISYTTRIATTRTVAEVTDLLARAGAQRIATEYSEGRPIGISFALTTEAFGPRIFELPVNVDAMHHKMVTLSKARKLAGLSQADGQSREQAERVAWRVVRSWLTVQISLLETGMIPLEQLMFAHLKSGGFDSPTVYEVARSRPEVLSIESRSNS